MNRIRVEIPSNFPNVRDVPVHVEVLNASMDPVHNRWTTLGGNTEINVEPGFYVVQAELPSGHKLQKALQVTAGETASAVLDTEGLSPDQFQAWAYLTKNMTVAPLQSLNAQRFHGAWLRLWRKDNNGWQTTTTDFQADCHWSEDGVSYDLASFGGPQFLQVGGPSVAWKLVALPGAQNLRILIRPAVGPEGEVHPLDVTVATANPPADSMLSMLSSGSVDRARQMDNAGLAESLLYGKIRDPSAAAVGGYFLLKIRDLNRLHDWTRNLANWIDWMADGPVIRAWHILLQASKDADADRDAVRAEARGLLLQAVERGIPTYTEGLRLLRDGLTSLSHYQDDDAQVQAAKAQVDRYAEQCDWSTPTTTFLGASPDEPMSEPLFGKPESLEDIAFLFAVDTEELVRQGILPVGAEISLSQSDGSRVQAAIQEGGKVKLGGKLYPSLEQVAATIGYDKVSIQDMIARGIDQTAVADQIKAGVESLRLGKLTNYVQSKLQR